MSLAMSRKIFIRLFVYGNSFSNAYLLSVRRNASSISPLGGRPLLSDALNISNMVMSKGESVQQKKTAAISALLREYGFTDAQISKLETKVPVIFGYRPENNLSLKLKFLASIGISTVDIPKFIIGSTYLLTSSFEKKLIPCYNYLKNLCVCEEQLHRVLRSHPGTITVNLEKTIAPNVELLRGMDVPSSIITYCVTHSYLALCCSHEQFKRAVDQAIRFGLNPCTKMFILAIRVLCGNSKQQWDLKMELYRGFGLSDKQILLAFRNQPLVMAMSEKKIVRGLEFFLKELGWAPATLVSDPVVLLMSLERRIIPRRQVMDILRKKGLLNDTAARPYFFKIGEEQFMKKYIDIYKDVLPELMDIYGRSSSSKAKLNMPKRSLLRK